MAIPSPLIERGFISRSRLGDEGLALGLAPALTPEGIDPSPSFFHGFATHPKTLAQGLLTLADITATRYFQFVPTSLRDPVLTAHGDRLRAEVFSADNSVYARLDLLGTGTNHGLDGGEIGYGTTNVDIGQNMRRSLALVSANDLLHLDIGAEGLTTSTLRSSVLERTVEMPARWIRAFGNAAELHQGLVPRFELNQAQSRTFISMLPPASAKGKSGWLVPTPTGVRLAQRPPKGQTSVYVESLNRLSALKRLLLLSLGLTVYGNLDDSPGETAVEVQLPGARLLLALTASSARGYSGEGSLLMSLSSPGVLDNAALVSALLAFEPIIEIGRLSTQAGIEPTQVRAALAVLAVSGRVGWDLREAAYFHRELPDESSRVERDNPRLVRARSIAGRPEAVRPVSSPDAWDVDGGNGVHRVSGTPEVRSCTCPWYLRYGSSRGPCAHQLAVEIFESEYRETP